MLHHWLVCVLINRRCLDNFWEELLINCEPKSSQSFAPFYPLVELFRLFCLLNFFELHSKSLNNLLTCLCEWWLKGPRWHDECTSHTINLLSFLRVVTSLFFDDWLETKKFSLFIESNSNKINELRGSALEFGLKESHCSDRNFLPLLRNRAHEKQKSVTIGNCTMILISEDHSCEEWITRLFMMMRLHLFSTFPLNSEAFSSHAKHS